MSAFSGRVLMPPEENACPMSAVDRFLLPVADAVGATPTPAAAERAAWLARADDSARRGPRP